MKQSSLRLLFLIIVSIRSFLLGPMMHFPRTLCIFSLELKLSIQHNWTVLVNPLAYFNWQTSIHEYNTMDHGKHKQEKNFPCATPFLRGVEFFLHWKRGERKGTAQGTILLLFLFINCKNAATACQVETALSSCNLLPELLWYWQYCIPSQKINLQVSFWMKLEFV